MGLTRVQNVSHNASILPSLRSYNASKLRYFSYQIPSSKRLRAKTHMHLLSK